MKTLYYLSISAIWGLFFLLLSCSYKFTYSLKKDINMEIKSRNFNVFYANEPKQIYIAVTIEFNPDSFRMEQLTSLLVNTLTRKHNLDIERNYFVQHFFVPYFEYDKKAKQLIMYYELKNNYYKKRYNIFKRCTLFPNNIVIFSFK